MGVIAWHITWHDSGKAINSRTEILLKSGWNAPLPRLLMLVAYSTKGLILLSVCQERWLLGQMVRPNHIVILSPFDEVYPEQSRRTQGRLGEESSPRNALGCERRILRSFSCPSLPACLRERPPHTIERPSLSLPRDRPRSPRGPCSTTS